MKDVQTMTAWPAKGANHGLNGEHGDCKVDTAMSRLTIPYIGSLTIRSNSRIMYVQYQ